MISLASKLDYSSYSPIKLVKSLWGHEYTDFRLIFEQSDELHYFYIKSNTQRLVARCLVCACLAIIFTITALSLHSSLSIWRYEKLVTSKIEAEKKRKEAFEALADLSDEPQTFSEEIPQSRLLAIAHKYKDDLNKMHHLVEFSTLELARANRTLELGLKASGMSWNDIERIEKNISAKHLASGGPANEITLDAPSTKMSEDYKKSLVKNEALNSFLSSFPTTAPVSHATTSSKFGPRIHPVTGKLSLHEGLDYVPTSDLYARNVLAGTVETIVFDNHGYGNLVTVSHSNGIRTLYGHLSLVSVKLGQKIIKGTPIGKIGNTGLSTGTHLHFEIAENNTKTNPSIIMAMAKNVQ